MSRALALFLLLFGVLAGLVASGALHTLPELSIRWPAVNSAFPYPVIAFALSALALALKPRFLNAGFVTTSALLLVLSSAFALAPSLSVPASLDGQSGMYEAWVAIATLPAATVLLAVSALPVAGSRGRSKNGA